MSQIYVYVYPFPLEPPSYPSSHPSESEVTWVCLTLCDSMDCSPPGSSGHWIFQARILGWVAIPFSMESSQPRDWTRVSRTAGRLWSLSHQWIPTPALWVTFSFLCCTAASHWLCVLRTVVYICQCYFSVLPTLSFPYCVHKSSLYICVSVLALQIFKLESSKDSETRLYCVFKKQTQNTKMLCIT